MSQYVESQTLILRTAMQGNVDKLVQVDALADNYCQQREMQEIVLRAISGVGSRADDQAAAWAAFCKALPYRREPVEILRNPLQTAQFGGDCDDIVCLLLAGWKCLGVPCEPEIIADDKDNGFHIRALCGFPVLNPQMIVVVDPVTQGEISWATAMPQDLPATPPAQSLSLTAAISPAVAAAEPQQWWRPVVTGLAIVGGITLLRSLFGSEQRA